MIKTKGLIALFLLLAAANVHAVKFGVHVVSGSGEPVAGVAVCIGTHGNYRQFGAHFTSRTGNVELDVPNVPLVVTISKNRFTGVRLTEPARRFNLIKEVKLIDGIPGPRCRAGTSLVEDTTNPQLQIVDVMVETGDKRVSLFPKVAGAPSHYRISTNSNFSGAQWKPYSHSIALNTQEARSESVYMQLRRYTAVKSSWLEARSSVINVALPQL